MLYMSAIRFISSILPAFRRVHFWVILTYIPEINCRAHIYYCMRAPSSFKK